MLFDTAIVGHRPEDALAFIVEILQSSTEYSLIGTDLEGAILLWNEGSRRLYGYESEEILGKTTSEILYTPEDIAAGLPAAMRKRALRCGTWEGLLTPVRKNGWRFLASAVLTPRFDPSGRRSGYLLVSKDVTDEIPAAQTEQGRLASILRQVYQNSGLGGGALRQAEKAVTERDSRGSSLLAPCRRRQEG